VDRVDLSDDKLRRRLQDGVKKFSRHGMVKPGAWGEFARHLHYQQGDFKTLYTYTALGAHCAKLEKQWGAKAHRIFYMATPPSLFGDIQKYLGKAGLARDREWARIVVEKPIGYARMKVIISKPPACAVWQDTDVRYPDPMIMGYLLSNEGEFTTTRSGHTAALGVSHLPPKPSSLRAEDSQGRWYKNSRPVRWIFCRTDGSQCSTNCPDIKWGSIHSIMINVEPVAQTHDRAV
jgi:hypothetical protein